MAVLWTQADQSLAVNYRELQDASLKLGIQLQALELRGPDDFVSAFETATMERVEGVSRWEARWSWPIARAS